MNKLTRELQREKEKKNEIKDQVKKNMNKLTRDRPRPEIWGGDGTVLPPWPRPQTRPFFRPQTRPFFKPQTKPLFIPKEEAEVGSGLPPGAMARPLPRLLEEEEGMSMVQLRGQERDEEEEEDEDEVDDEMYTDKSLRRKIKSRIRREKLKRKLSKYRPRPAVWGGDGTWLPRPQTRPFFKPQTKPLFIPQEETIFCPPEPTACVFPPEMLDRPEVAECEEVVVCQPPEQAEVGSGLPPGATPRL